MIQERNWCFGSVNKGFPTFAAIILVVGVIWLLNDLKIFSFEIPWFPVILIIIAAGWIINHYMRK